MKSYLVNKVVRAYRSARSFGKWVAEVFFEICNIIRRVDDTESLGIISKLLNIWLSSTPPRWRWQPKTFSNGSWQIRWLKTFSHLVSRRNISPAAQKIYLKVMCNILICHSQSQSCLIVSLLNQNVSVQTVPVYPGKVETQLYTISHISLPVVHGLWNLLRVRTPWVWMFSKSNNLSIIHPNLAISEASSPPLSCGNGSFLLPVANVHLLGQLVQPAFWKMTSVRRVYTWVWEPVRFPFLQPCHFSDMAPELSYYIRDCGI